MVINISKSKRAVLQYVNVCLCVTEQMEHVENVKLLILLEPCWKLLSYSVRFNAIKAEWGVSHTFSSILLWSNNHRQEFNVLKGQNFRKSSEANRQHWPLRIFCVYYKNTKDNLQNRFFWQFQELVPRLEKSNKLIKQSDSTLCGSESVFRPCPIECSSFTLRDACRLWPQRQTGLPTDTRRLVYWQASVKPHPAGSYTAVPYLLKRSQSMMNGGLLSLPRSSPAHLERSESELLAQNSPRRLHSHPRGILDRPFNSTGIFFLSWRIDTATGAHLQQVIQMCFYQRQKC